MFSGKSQIGNVGLLCCNQLPWTVLDPPKVLLFLECDWKRLAKVFVISDDFQISEVSWPLNVWHIPFVVRLKWKPSHPPTGSGKFLLLRSSLNAQSMISLSYTPFLLTKLSFCMWLKDFSAVSLQIVRGYFDAV